MWDSVAKAVTAFILEYMYMYVHVDVHNSTYNP